MRLNPDEMMMGSQGRLMAGLAEWQAEADAHRCGKDDVLESGGNDDGQSRPADGRPGDIVSWSDAVKAGSYFSHGYFVELQNRKGYFDAITMRLEIVF